MSSTTTVVISIPGGITLTITTPAAHAADAPVLELKSADGVEQAPAPAPGRSRAAPPGFVDRAAMLEENRRLLGRAEKPVDAPDEVGEPADFDLGEDEEVLEEAAPPPGRGRQVTPAEALALVAGGSDAPRGPRAPGASLDRRIAARLRTGAEPTAPVEGFAPPFSRTPKK